MSDLVSYEADGLIATIRMDDGRVNALSVPMLTALLDAFSSAEAAGLAVVLTGREGIFSAGFDLKTIEARGAEYLSMVRMGFELSARLLAFPRPVVIACTGHAIAMGSFLLLSGDYRVGVSDPVRIGPNEVANGMVMPLAAIEICRQRLTPSAFSRALINAEPFSGERAVQAGFLDRVVERHELVPAAYTEAQRLAELDRVAHLAAKLRVRGEAIAAIQAGLEDDLARLTPKR